MAYKVSDIIEYIIAVVSEFASRFNLTDKQAYRYLSFHKGISFLEEYYGIIHTLDFNEAVDSVALFAEGRVVNYEALPRIKYQNKENRS